MSWLWERLHDLFDTDDGSLPEIRVNYSMPASTVAGYSLLRRRAASINEDAKFWCETRGEALPLDSVENVASLLVSGEAEAFHLLLRGIEYQGTSIPDLGVFVFPEQLALDYRMGPAWGPAELEALFYLLADLSRLDDRASFSLEEGVLPQVESRFQGALQKWLRRDAAEPPIRPPVVKR